MSEPKPQPTSLPRLALTLAIGAFGGFVFSLAGLPLAWMIGAMVATCVASVGGIPLKADQRLRSAMVVVLGIMLGGAFGPETLSTLRLWVVTALGLIPYVAVSMIVALAYLHRVAKLDTTTAFFAGAPGGLNEMAILGGDAGGDVRVISLSHAARVMLVVVTMPVILSVLGLWTFGNQVGLATVAEHAEPISVRDVAILSTCALGGAVARMFGLPAAWLLGSMILSIAVHALGLTSADPPVWLIAVAQVVVGSALGSRFAGTSARTVGKIIVVAIGLTAILLAITGLFSFLMGWLTGLGAAAILLAYAPGGIAEMGLVALSLGVDPAFVATHHLLRITLVLLLAPVVFAVYRRRAGQRTNEDTS